MAKVQKIKSKYHKYANLLIIVASLFVFLLVFFYAANKGYFNNSAEMKANGSGDDAFSKESNKSFQPGDEKAYIPGKLKWGRDF